VYRKVRVADVIDTDATLPFELGRYALRAHFDFVVTDREHVPQFAVEFDGPGHSTIHDAKKDELSRRDNLALFRVDLRSSQDRSGEMSFLGYLLHLWFLAPFQEMQARGEIPADEPFVTSGFLRPDAKNTPCCWGWTISDFELPNETFSTTMECWGVRSGFKIVDGNKQTIAYVYGHADPRDAETAKGLTLNEAWRIARNIAKLPELLRKPWAGVRSGASFSEQALLSGGWIHAIQGDRYGARTQQWNVNAHLSHTGTNPVNATTWRQTLTGCVIPAVTKRQKNSQRSLNKSSPLAPSRNVSGN
jgi:hypothetical protein